MKKRKVTAMILCAMTALALAACGSGSGSGQAAPALNDSVSEDAGSDSSSADSAASGTGKSTILIAYFSVPESDGTDAVAGASRVVTEDGQILGNNEYIAQLIRQETGGDLFAIETVQEYPGSHDALLDFAYNEKAENARPKLATQIENPDAYDTIFLGYPKMEQGYICV